MTHFLSLAFRNVFRNRRRTAMTMVIVSGGVTALLLAGGFFALMFTGIRENTIQNGLGHLQIYNADFFTKEERRTLDNGLADYASVIETAQGLPHVKGLAPRIEFFGMVSNGQKSPTYMAQAVDPAAEERMGFRPKIQSGRNLSVDPSVVANEVILGAGLARSLDVKPGDGLTMLAVTGGGALNGIDVEVVGTFTQGFKEIDDRALRLTVPAAQQLLQTNRVTKLVVGLDNTDFTDASHAALVARLAQGPRRDVTVKKWPELATVYQQVRLMFGAIFLFMCTLVVFMVVVSTANTMLMAMFERTREIGTMLALGTPRTWILALFLVEGLLTGLLGAALGLAGGNTLIALINAAKIQIPTLPGNSEGFALAILHVPGLMIAASMLVILTLAAASVIPAIRAARLRIVESLAHV
jgi:putative ABC transport system permease protein